METLKSEKQRLNLRVDELSQALNQYSKGKTNSMGLLLDEHRTAEYKALKSEFNQAFQELRSFNGKYAKLLRQSA